MNAAEIIQTRRSIGRLGGEAPNQEQVKCLIEAALAAPDHGRLRPWQFIEVRGQQRQQLAEVFLQAALAENPDLEEERKRKILNMPLRAPLILIVVAKVVLEHKIPVIEQVVSAGAAVQNMLIVAEEMGIGAMWRTGEMAYKSEVKRSLGLKTEDEIVAYLYLGEAQIPKRPRDEIGLENHWVDMSAIPG